MHTELAAQLLDFTVWLLIMTMVFVSIERRVTLSRLSATSQ